jgi:alkylglycerol monooxygenase
METYAKILMIAVPSFLGLVILEKSYGYFVKKDVPRFFDLIASLSSGITNSVKDVLQLSFTILSYAWLVDHVAIFTIENKLATYIIAFVALDLSGYWVHRIAHSINFFWNKHAIHHSSEEFDLACALRQSISSFVGIFTIFLLPAAILGVPAQVVAVVGPIQFFAQFWYHTVYIKKMGFLEHILVTPSHHRVHHAINKEYIDKNLAQIFIIWDKIFGTFQEELDSAPCVYGISRPPSTWNPIKINFQHLFLLIKDAYRSPNLMDKLTIWFKPTGWRPAGFDEKYPVDKITNPYTYKKYTTKTDLSSKVWIFIQFMFTAYLMLMLYCHIADLNFYQMIAVGVFIYLNVYTYSEYMDGNKSWFMMEILKNVIFIVVLSSPYLDGLFSNNMSLKIMTAGLLVVFSISSFLIKDSRNDAKTSFATT